MGVVARTSGAEDILSAARRVAAALGAGALAGAIVGGIGGRIAMLVLRLTSDPVLHGFETDDGFTIGIVSGATLFLVGLTTILGSIGGLAYLLVRPWLPERVRPWIWGLLGALVGGANIVRPGGIDFSLLDPLPVAIAMFVLIPALGAAVTSLLAERFLRPTSRFARSRASLGLLLLLVPVLLGGSRAVAGAFGPILVLALAAAVVWSGRGPDIARLWRSAPMVWLGRAGLLAVAISAGAELAGDVGAIL